MNNDHMPHIMVVFVRSRSSSSAPESLPDKHDHHWSIHFPSWTGVPIY